MAKIMNIFSEFSDSAIQLCVFSHDCCVDLCSNMLHRGPHGSARIKSSLPSAQKGLNEDMRVHVKKDAVHVRWLLLKIRSLSILNTTITWLGQFFGCFLLLWTPLNWLCLFVVINPSNLGATRLVAQALYSPIIKLSQSEDNCFFYLSLLMTIS